MRGFFDARCPKCNARIGWFGTMADKPPCHRCGKAEDRQELKAAGEAMSAAMLESLKAQKPQTPIEKESFAEGQAWQASHPSLIHADAVSQCPHPKGSEQRQWWFRGWRIAKVESASAATAGE